VTPLSAFLPYVLPHAYGCPDPTAEQAVRDACIEFCSKSSLIQAVDTQTLVAGLAEYAVGTPAGQDLSQVLSVSLGAIMLSPVAPSDVRHGAALRAGVDSTVAPFSGPPALYYQITPTDRVLYLWPVPADTGALAIKASYAPSRTATEVDDVLFDDWAYEIACGALARLLSMPAQVFSNPKYAEAHGARFSAAIASAVSAARRGRLPGAVRAQSRSFV